MNWSIISYAQTLSENFIIEFENKVDWESISYAQSLSESFIREYHDILDWDYISLTQTLSETFINQYQHKICWYWFLQRSRVDDRIKQKFYVYQKQISPEEIEYLNQKLHDVLKIR
ncbi:hypothetical protein D3C76_1523980 [compost metagenome]